MLMKEGGGVLTGLVYFETLLMNCGVNCETHTHTHTACRSHATGQRSDARSNYRPVIYCARSRRPRSHLLFLGESLALKPV